MFKFTNKKLQHNIIYETDDSYIFYDLYKIVKTSDKLYKVVRFTDLSEYIFTSSRNATTWIILDRYNKIIEARRTHELDKKLSSLDAELMLHKKLQICGAMESREINRDKYLVVLDRLRHFKWELDKYIMLAKICQEKGYQNELTRVTRN